MAARLTSVVMAEPEPPQNPQLWRIYELSLEILDAGELFERRFALWVEAKDSGIPVTEIARASGLTDSAIHIAIARKRASTVQS